MAALIPYSFSISMAVLTTLSLPLYGFRLLYGFTYHALSLYGCTHHALSFYMTAHSIISPPYGLNTTLLLLALQ
jgi:hypothetical protein